MTKKPHLIASQNHKRPDTWDIIDANKIPESWGQQEAAKGWPFDAYLESGFGSQQEAEARIAFWLKWEEAEDEKGN